MTTLQITTDGSVTQIHWHWICLSSANSWVVFHPISCTTGTSLIWNWPSSPPLHLGIYWVHFTRGDGLHVLLCWPTSGSNPLPSDFNPWFLAPIEEFDVQLLRNVFSFPLLNCCTLMVSASTWRCSLLGSMPLYSPPSIYCFLINLSSTCFCLMPSMLVMTSSSLDLF